MEFRYDLFILAAEVTPQLYIIPDIKSISHTPCNYLPAALWVLQNNIASLCYNRF